MDGLGEGGTIELTGTTAGAAVDGNLRNLVIAAYDHRDGLVGTMADTGVTLDIIGGSDTGEGVEDCDTHLIALFAREGEMLNSPCRTNPGTCIAFRPAEPGREVHCGHKQSLGAIFRGGRPEDMRRTLDDAEVAGGAMAEIPGNRLGGRRHNRFIPFDDELPLAIIDFDTFFTFSIQLFGAVVGLSVNPAFLDNFLSPGQ